MDVNELKAKLGGNGQASSSLYEPVPMTINLRQSDVQAASARAIMLYGDSGLGKTTQCKYFIRRMYELYKKPLRGVFAEDSSQLILKPLIDIGVLQAVFITKTMQPLVVLRRLSRGEWPIFKPDGSIEWIRQEQWAGSICGYIWEGLTSTAEIVLEDLRDKHRFLREQKSDAFEEGGEKVATASQTAYGVAQMEILRALRSFSMLPVERLLITAHEGAGVDEDTRKPIRGPALVGSAATDKVRKYCGVLLHIQQEQNGERRIYFIRHSDAGFQNVSCPAKTTVPPEKVGELLKAFPGGFFVPDLKGGLDRFLDVEAQLIAQATEEDAEWKKRIDAA